MSFHRGTSVTIAKCQLFFLASGCYFFRVFGRYVCLVISYHFLTIFNAVNNLVCCRLLNCFSNQKKCAVF